MNKSLLPKYVGRKVLFIGKNTGVTDEMGLATLEGSDGQAVSVKLSPGEVIDAPFVMVWGKVDHAGSVVDSFRIVPMNAEFDMAMYHKVLTTFVEDKYQCLFQ